MNCSIEGRERETVQEKRHSKVLYNKYFFVRYMKKKALSFLNGILLIEQEKARDDPLNRT